MSNPTPVQYFSCNDMWYFFISGIVISWYLVHDIRYGYCDIWYHDIRYRYCDILISGMWYCDIWYCDTCLLIFGIMISGIIIHESLYLVSWYLVSWYDILISSIIMMSWYLGSLNHGIIDIQLLFVLWFSI